VTADPGPIRLWDFQRGIADAISDPLIERVTVIKSARVGYTTLLTATVGNYVLNEPAPILFVLPTEADCRDYVVSDMDPIFEASPDLRGLLSDGTDETGRNTILHRLFAGGSLKVVAAKSPRNLRRHNTRILIIDEEDGMDPTPEGDPVDLAIKRTLGFPNRKIIRGSTPTDADRTTIAGAYEQSDQRVYEIKCVECGEFAEPRWAHIRWDKGSPQTARWACPNCGVLVEERFKLQMVANGRWRAMRPEVEGHAGFRLSALISPHANASWAKLAEEWTVVHDSPESRQTFVNTLLGEVTREEINIEEPETVMARAEAFGLNVTHASEDGAHETLALPAEVLLITAGVDEQDDRFEVTFCGWSRDGAMWALGHSVIWGSPADHETLAELDVALSTKWTHPLGGKIGVGAAAVDSGDGEFSQTIYGFCWPRARRGVMAIKGVGGRRPIIEVSKGRIAKGGTNMDGKLWLVGADQAKARLYADISRGPGRVRFSRSLPLVWFEQLLSEPPVIRRIAGRPVRKFERIPGRRAEALDTTVYALAARMAFPSVDFDALEARLAEKSAPPAKRTLADMASRLNGASQ
jgi:phage terminase large subunit GpA-like protein